MSNHLGQLKIPERKRERPAGVVVSRGVRGAERSRVRTTPKASLQTLSIRYGGDHPKRSRRKGRVRSSFMSRTLSYLLIMVMFINPIFVAYADEVAPESEPAAPEVVEEEQTSEEAPAPEPEAPVSPPETPADESVDDATDLGVPDSLDATPAAEDGVEEDAVEGEEGVGEPAQEEQNTEENTEAPNDDLDSSNEVPQTGTTTEDEVADNESGADTTDEGGAMEATSTAVSEEDDSGEDTASSTSHMASSTTATSTTATSTEDGGGSDTGNGSGEDTGTTTSDGTDDQTASTTDDATQDAGSGSTGSGGGSGGNTSQSGGGSGSYDAGETTATTTDGEGPETNESGEGYGGGTATTSDETGEGGGEAAETDSDKVASTTTATSTEESREEVPEEGEYTEGVNTVVNADNRYVFGERECTLVADGEFHCIIAGEDSDTDANDQVIGVQVRKDADGDKEIYYRDASGEQKITNNVYDDDEPYFDENTGRIAWQSLVEDRWQIMVHNIFTGVTTQVTNSRGNNTNVHADGETLVWQGWDNGDWEIYYTQNAHEGQSGVQKLTDNDTHDMFPQVSSNLITWQGASGAGWMVYVHDLYTHKTTEIGENTGGKYENPRFVLLMENRKENGDVETIGYDIASGETIPLGTSSQVPIPTDVPQAPTQEQGQAVPTSATSTQLKTTKNTDSDPPPDDGG